MIIVFYPIYFVVVASFTEPTYVNSGALLLYPKEFTLSGYKAIFAEERVWSGYFNTILYTLGGTVAGTAAVVMAGYAFSRKDLPGAGLLMKLYVFTMYFGGGTIPLFLVVRRLGLVDTRAIMILLGCVSTYNIIVVRSFMQSNIPEELYDAAIIDGCGQGKFFLLSEDRQRRNRLLQHLIYGKDCDTEYFREAMREEGLFGRAESYRVVLVASAGRSEADMGQIESFLEERQDREYEIQLLDIPNRNAAAMIVGMTEAKKAGLEEELLRIAGCVDERSRFFVGGEAAGLSKINLSYNQALSLGRSGGKEGQGRILYYQPGPASAEDGKKGKGDADMKSGEAGEEQTDKEDFIRSVTDFIDRNSRSPELSASMVSDFFGISVSRMSHRFKAQTGRTISDYITEKKFLYVCELLTETEESVKDIAFLVGYSHSVSFMRKFRQLHGMTPVEYRERKRAAENVENKENQE